MVTLGDYLIVSGILFTIGFAGVMVRRNVITVAAAEVAVGLAIVVALFRLRQTTHVEDITSLKF